jgi:hypothetical protein
MNAFHNGGVWGARYSSRRHDLNFDVCVCEGDEGDLVVIRETWEGSEGLSRWKHKSTNVLIWWGPSRQDWNGFPEGGGRANWRRMEGRG